MKRYFYYLVFSLFLLTNCNKQKSLADENLVFIGDWSSKDYFIIIATNGYGFCQHKNKPEIEGNVFIKNDKITFKSDGGRKHKFDIDEPPFEEGREIMMELDGDLFYKH